MPGVRASRCPAASRLLPQPGGLEGLGSVGIGPEPEQLTVPVIRQMDERHREFDPTPHAYSVKLDEDDESPVSRISVISKRRLSQGSTNSLQNLRTPTWPR